MTAKIKASFNFSCLKCYIHIHIYIIFLKNIIEITSLPKPTVFSGILIISVTVYAKNK